MSYNLLESAKGLFTNELISKISSSLNESEGATSKAISGIVPSVIAGLADKASSTQGADMITKLAQEYHQSGILNNIQNFLGKESAGVVNKSSMAMNNLFGSTASSQLINNISSFSGISSSSSASLLGISFPMILGLLGKHAANSPVGSTSITTSLSNVAGHLSNAIPAGLSLGSLFKFGNSTQQNATYNFTKQATTSNTSGSSFRWLLPLLLLLVAGALAWYLFKDGCNKRMGTVSSGIDSIASSIDSSAKSLVGKVDSLTGEYIYNEGDTITIDLPGNGGKLTVGKNSTEYKLVQFLNDKNAQVDTVKGNWFEFTNVHFKSGTATLTDESLAQLKNIALIFKAFPSAAFKIGGYTDSTGNAAMNIVLSQKRADLVSHKIDEFGAPSTSIISTKGYGQEWPIADNSTVEGRAINRRVAVNVKAK